MASAPRTLDPSSRPPTCDGLTHRDDFLGAAFHDGITRFRVWAPEAARVEVQVDDSKLTIALTRSPEG